MIQYRPIGHHFPKRQSACPILCCLFLSLIFISALALYAFIHYTDPLSEYNVSLAFEAFTTEYGKVYSSRAEKEQRKAIFSANYRKILQINSESHPYTLGLNQFADLTDDEFARYYLTENPVPKSVLAQEAPVTFSDPLTPAELAEDEIDWVKDGLVTPVKDQGMCGSCWTFGTISTVESRYAKIEGKLLRFSEQQLVDCCRTDRSQGCHGGEVEDAMSHLAENGNALYKDYPYKAMDEPCKIKEIHELVKAVEGYQPIKPHDSAEMQRVLKTHTMYISVNSRAFVFRFYKDGVITDGCPSEPLTHGIALVGSGTTDEGIPYWKVRNSWGPNWGDKGYAYILRDVSKPNPGVCGIARHAVYPLYMEAK